MKRFAAHRLYLASERKMLVMQVVELDDLGNVNRIFPLAEEVRQTEWIGGIIVVTAENLQSVRDQSFRVFLSRLSAKPEKEIKAWHVTSFDVSAMEFTSCSRIVRLQ